MSRLGRRTTSWIFRRAILLLILRYTVKKQSTLFSVLDYIDFEIMYMLISQVVFTDIKSVQESSAYQHEHEHQHQHQYGFFQSSLSGNHLQKNQLSFLLHSFCTYYNSKRSKLFRPLRTSIFLLVPNVFIF